jgi:hypothetical protein
MKPSEQFYRSETEPAQVNYAESRRVDGFDCDQCGQHFKGTPAGSGLFLWTRGDETRFEEPPLCEECAMRSSVGALFKWDVEDGEDEG